MPDASTEGCCKRLEHESGACHNQPLPCTSMAAQKYDVKSQQAGARPGAQPQIGSTHLQAVFQTLQRDSDDAHIRACQQVAQRLDTALGDHILDLIMCAARSGIADGPCRLLANVKLGCAQQVN